MSILSKLLSRVPPPKGIRLDTQRPFWEMAGKTDFPALLSALADLLPGDCVLYFEGGSPNPEILAFLREHAVPERAHVAQGTIWPKPLIFHVPANSETMSRLAELTRLCAYPELAIHFHIYCDGSVLLEWHDFFTQPMLLSGELPEQKVRMFAERLQLSYKRGVEQAAPPNGGPTGRPSNSGFSGGPPSVS